MSHEHSFRKKRTPTYNSWRKMKDRCLNPKEDNYKNYGAKGITICERWMSFKNFLIDMGERPIGMSIDRLNSNGNYEPSNCRWATSSQQEKNKSKKLKKSTSKYKGVSWDKANNKWAAFIKPKGHKQIRLGRFEIEEEAAKAYDKAALKYYGTDTYFNFPEEIVKVLQSNSDKDIKEDK